MNIYRQSNGWRGSVIVVADSKEEAIKMMKKEKVFDEETEEEIEEYEIVPGLILVDYGDQ